MAGVSGSGKTTAGGLLAERLGWQFVDGDSLHPAANIAKMARGEPLTDADRAPWLRRIGDRIDAEEAAGRHSVIACSALKRQYRTELLGGRPEVRMVFLALDYGVAHQRLAARSGHFFDASLLGSQFTALEPPAPEEARVLTVSARAEPAQIATEIIRDLGLDPSP